LGFQRMLNYLRRGNLCQFVSKGKENHLTKRKENPVDNFEPIRIYFIVILLEIILKKKALKYSIRCR